MSELTKVSMDFTESDLKNTDRLRERLKLKSNADTVSAALAMASSFAEHMTDAKDCIIHTKDGKTFQLVVPGL
jgi:hypothetical protein